MKKYGIGCLVLAAIGVVIAIILGMYGVGKYNALVGLSQGVDTQWAQVQNVYQRRADLIPNLVSTVKGAAEFEKSTLTQVIQARASATQVKIDPNKAPTDPAQLAQYQQAQAGLSSALSRLLVSVEAYPDLKANGNFRDLQAQLEGTENRISVERGRFNEAAQTYNVALKRFPTVLFAAMMGFQPRPYFKAVEGAATPPKVNFDFGAQPAKS